MSLPNTRYVAAGERQRDSSHAIHAMAVEGILHLVGDLLLGDRARALTLLLLQLLRGGLILLLQLLLLVAVSIHLQLYSPSSSECDHIILEARIDRHAAGQVQHSP